MKPVQATLQAPCSVAELFGWVSDLGRYPAWLELVRRAEPRTAPAGTALDRIAPAWSVVLAASVGPLRRSKKLTMIRTQLEADRYARFERSEPDGKLHAAWVLDAEVRATSGASELVMTMSYDGSWWGPLMERVLAEQIEAARPRLIALVAGS